MKYISINTGQPKHYDFSGQSFDSSIIKKKSDKPLFLLKLGLENDTQSDNKHHGGENKAVYFNDIETYLSCQTKLGRKFEFGDFGDTVTTQGMTEDTICIGDIFRFGEAIVQITQPKQPCYKLGYVFSDRTFPSWLEESGLTGIYAKVLQEGLLQTHGDIELLERHPMKLTVAYVNTLLINDKENKPEMLRILKNEFLSPSIVRVFTNRLNGEIESNVERLYGKIGI